MYIIYTLPPPVRHSVIGFSRVKGHGDLSDETGNKKHDTEQHDTDREYKHQHQEKLQKRQMIRYISV